MNRELLKRVIAECSDKGIRSNITTKLYGAITEYLEMPEPEPVAWMWEDGLEVYFENSGDPDHNWVPLYTTPPDQSARIAELERQISVERGQVKIMRERLNVRFNEGLRMGHADSYRAMKSAQEAKDRYYSENEGLTNQIEQLEQQLAALQAKREPLSDDEIRDCAESENLPYFENKEEFDAFARAIEAAHSIGTNHD